MKASMAKLPMNRITVNLAPANIKKSGPSFDLPMAIGILKHD
jgi:magnesium chelatase family protein